MSFGDFRGQRAVEELEFFRVLQLFHLGRSHLLVPAAATDVLQTWLPSGTDVVRCSPA